MSTERWDRDRLMYERDRFQDEQYHPHGARGWDHSDERFDRPRFYEEDNYVRRRHYDDMSPEPRVERMKARRPIERDRRVIDLERDRDRDGYVNVESRRRPVTLRRQSSLDTFDRRPLRPFYERDELPPPARREDIYRHDHRMPAYTPIPLPQTRALPPPRRYANHGFYDDSVDDADADPDLFRPYPERAREHEPELVRSRERRDRSRDALSARSRDHRSSVSSRSSSVSTSRSSSSVEAASARARARYPRRGKTKIPIKLVSKQALVDLGYPFFEEGNTIVQRALGQENIDELLKLSDDYNKVDLEVAAARSAAGLLEDSREPREEPPAPPSVHSPPAMAPPPPVARAPPTPVSAAALEAPAPPPPPPPPPPAAVPFASPATMSPPHVVDAGPPPVEVMDRARTIRYVSVRDVSPARSVTTSTASSWDAPHRHHRHNHHRHHHHHRNDALVVRRSHSRSGREIRAEIKALEHELVHRPRGDICEREIVRTERTPDGELIIYQDKVECRSAGPKPLRIEKDKKGRISISIPKYR